jgi:Skp family chaperone for outer membrane proteins
MRFLIIFSAVCIIISCSQNEIQTEDKNNTAFVDLDVLYEFVLEHDKDYSSFKNSLIEKNRTKEELSEAENEIKKAVLLQVDSAVRYVASERGIDIILNKSDTLIYGSTRTDITQIVLNELKVRIYRNTPASN